MIFKSITRRNGKKMQSGSENAVLGKNNASSAQQKTHHCPVSKYRQ
jgi:hypothetical protein